MLFTKFTSRAVVDFLSVLTVCAIVSPFQSWDVPPVFADELEGVEGPVLEVVEPEPDPGMVAADLGVYPYTKTFTITAYYSPLPCQERYSTGSYEAEKRLNGNGTHGADGTPVYPGMVAAPSSYGFGTKMYISGIGMTAVHDRGGAIVHSTERGNSYDRLDIWMGYGDKGLQRALNWGKRNVSVTVYGPSESMVEDVVFTDFSEGEAIPRDCSFVTSQTENDGQGVNEIVVPPAQPPVVLSDSVKIVQQPVIDDSSFNAPLQLGSSGSDVRQLQEELKNLNFLMIEPTGYYGEVTEHAVFKFQQANALVADKNSVGAGVFGPKTRAKLNSILGEREDVLKMVAAKSSDAGVQSKLALANTNSNSKVLLSSQLDFGAVSTDVETLQKYLQNEGYYNESFTSNYFGEVTREALIDFQLAKGIIATRNDVGAGRVGPSTLEIINS